MFGDTLSYLCYNSLLDLHKGSWEGKQYYWATATVLSDFYRMWSNILEGKAQLWIYILHIYWIKFNACVNPTKEVKYLTPNDFKSTYLDTFVNLTICIFKHLNTFINQYDIFHAYFISEQIADKP